MKTALICPGCGGDLSYVTDSRQRERNGFRVIRRRRTCDQCGNSLATIEIPEGVMDALLKAMARGVADDFMRRFK